MQIAKENDYTFSPNDFNVLLREVHKEAGARDDRVTSYLSMGEATTYDPLKVGSWP